jgi:two-component system, LytTR family, response regulator
MRASLRCIIVDDEPLAIEKLKRYVARVSALRLLECFASCEAALQFSQLNEIDVMFLDIRVGESLSTESLARVAGKTQVVFTTAYESFAVESYEFEATDYLLKPFDFNRFSQAVERCLRARLEQPPTTAPDHFFVRAEGKLKRLLVSDVLFIQGERDYRLIHTVNERVLVRETFQSLERRLPVTALCRVHRSFMVALRKVDAVERHALVVSGQCVPLSDRYRDNVLLRLGVASESRR